ncbi:3-dehydroquinate synthase [Oscillospiraceae bacterium CM]|nr:3-dehydroquinate synthase [Oscillospiraceae bacterium CM]
MKTIQVNASKTYDICIERGLLADAGVRIRTASGGSTCCVVTDDVVNALYGDQLVETLSAAGYTVVRFVIENGESSKNAENYIRLLNFLADSQLTRTDVVAALGGGVVGDLAGFAAATYLRGIHFVQLPTTLLAAVDSSIGGKTGIDLNAGKNLAGAFYQPNLVLCDPDVMKTLRDETFKDGVAEIIKYGVIADKTLFSMLAEPIAPRLDDIIARCDAIKRDVVSRDERESGPRKLLNFGHTVGHAIEALSNFSISHGCAVAVGMAVIARASAKSGFCSTETSASIIDRIQTNGLPTETNITADALARAARSDKKRSGGTITLVLPKEIGVCTLEEMPVDRLEGFFALGL